MEKVMDMIRREPKHFPADVVVVRAQGGRGVTAPHLSPFVVKLETYLRMIGVQYEFDGEAGFHADTQKMPWMSYCGVNVADSQHCMEFLNRKLDKDLNVDLSETDKAVAHGIRAIVEDSLYWSILAYRWVLRVDRDFLCRQNEYCSVVALRLSVSRHVRERAWQQGIMRHNQYEIIDIAERDMQALVTLLGEKLYMMGEKPTEIDACVFGMLSQIYWCMPGQPHRKIMMERFHTLVLYCDRMKEKFWPDWDDILKANPMSK